MTKGTVKTVPSRNQIPIFAEKDAALSADAKEPAEAAVWKKVRIFILQTPF